MPLLSTTQPLQAGFFIPTANFGEIFVSLIPDGGTGGLPLADGTQAAPSLAFALDLDLGMYRQGSNLATWVQSNRPVFDWGEGTIVNVDPVSPSTVRYAMRGYQPSQLGVNETGFLYCRIDPGVGSEQQAALYVDITSNQADTEGPAIKVIHAGHGDGIYVAQFADGSAYEAATWADGSRGYISTIQVAGLPNSTLFNGLWDQADVPNFGMFYADGVQGNAFVAHKRVGAADGTTAIKVTEFDGRVRGATYNDGSVDLQSLLATVGTPLRESPELRFKGATWDGAASDEVKITLKAVPTSATAYALRFFAELAGGGSTLLGLWHQNGDLDMQAHAITTLGVNGIQAFNNLNLFASGAKCEELEVPSVDNDTAMYLLVRTGGVNTIRRVTVGAADSGGVGFRQLLVPN